MGGECDNEGEARSRIIIKLQESGLHAPQSTNLDPMVMSLQKEASLIQHPLPQFEVAITKVRGNVKHVRGLLVIGPKKVGVGDVVGDTAKTFSQVHVCFTFKISEVLKFLFNM